MATLAETLSKRCIDGETFRTVWLLRSKTSEYVLYGSRAALTFSACGEEEGLTHALFNLFFLKPHAYAIQFQQ